MSDISEGRILIVEDDDVRCAWFAQKYAGREVDLTCDVREAIAWLASREYNVILLDHDLTEEHYYSDTPDDDNTGYAAAEWLASHPDRQRDATIVIHSLNYFGAERMLERLRGAGRTAEHVPFPYMQNGLLF